MSRLGWVCVGERRRLDEKGYSQEWLYVVAMTRTMMNTPSYLVINLTTLLYGDTIIKIWAVFLSLASLTGGGVSVDRKASYSRCASEFISGRYENFSC